MVYAERWHGEHPYAQLMRPVTPLELSDIVYEHNDWLGDCESWTTGTTTPFRPSPLDSAGSLSAIIDADSCGVLVLRLSNLLQSLTCPEWTRLKAGSYIARHQGPSSSRHQQSRFPLSNGGSIVMTGHTTSDEPIFAGSGTCCLQHVCFRPCMITSCSSPGFCTQVPSEPSLILK